MDRHAAAACDLVVSVAVGGNGYSAGPLLAAAAADDRYDVVVSLPLPGSTVVAPAVSIVGLRVRAVELRSEASPQSPDFPSECGPDLPVLDV